jgi:hypothetical protein
MPQTGGKGDPAFAAHIRPVPLVYMHNFEALFSLRY